MCQRCFGCSEARHVLMGGSNYSTGQISWLLHPTVNEDSNLGFSASPLITSGSLLSLYYLFDTDLWVQKWLGQNWSAGCYHTSLTFLGNCDKILLFELIEIFQMSVADKKRKGGWGGESVPSLILPAWVLIAMLFITQNEVGCSQAEQDLVVTCHVHWKAQRKKKHKPRGWTGND